MRFFEQFRVFATRSAVVAGAGLMFVCGPALSAFGQVPQAPPAAGVQTASPASTQSAPAPQTPAGTAPSRKLPTVVSPVENGSPLSIEDAVKMALENNLGIQESRMNPEMAEYALEQIQTSYAPELLSSFSQGTSAAPPTDFLSTGVAVVTTGSLTTTGSLFQQVKFGGGQYEVTWNGSRQTNDAPRAVFNPELGSGVTATYVQPLLQNFRIDQTREQVLQAKNNATISDLQLRQQITQTSYAVRAAYYGLVGAIENYKVAEESLEIAQQSLADDEHRLQVGTIPQMQIVSSTAEVASNEELVVINREAIEFAEDTLRILVMNKSQAGFWTETFKPTDPEQVTSVAIDVDAAVKNALQSRTDLLVFKKQIENNDVTMRFESNQKLPSANLQARYGVTGTGGTEFSYDPSGLSAIPIGSSGRSFSDVLTDVLHNSFKTWSVAVNFSYPLGPSPAGAAFAQAKILDQQYKTKLTDMETQVTIQVREAARQVAMNLKRVEVDTRARDLQQQKLDGEQRMFDVGLATALELTQAQRDLDGALRELVAAQIAYSNSLAAFQAIQLAPLS